MKNSIAAAAACALLLLSCNNDIQEPDDKVAQPLQMSPLSTSAEINLGAFHNEIMARMLARAALPMSISDDEFVAQLRRAANRAIEQYGPSREFTDTDCRMVLQVWSQYVAPYFDVTLRDPARSDPMAVVIHLRDAGMIDDQDVRQMEVLLGNGNSDSLSALSPTSEGISIAQVIHDASLSYWSGGRQPLRDEDGPPVKEIRNTSADALGGLIGWALGFGNPLCGLIGSGLSLVFICGGNDGGTSTGSGGGWASDPCHPHIGPPCD